MDWSSLAAAAVAIVSGGWGELQRRKAKAAVEAKKLAAELAKQALDEALTTMEAASKRATRTLASMIAAKIPGMGGAALLDQLEEARDSALEEGKKLALEQFRERVTVPMTKPPPTPSKPPGVP